MDVPHATAVPQVGTENPHGSEAVTEGVRITVAPAYAEEHSDPMLPRFVFSYSVRIDNMTDQPMQLVSRRWSIIDAHGRKEHVEGPGVVGMQPVIDPHDSFEYASWCPIQTSWGTMEGTYTMKRTDGTTIDASVGRFFLVVPE